MSIIPHQPGEADHGYAIQVWKEMAPGDEGVPVSVLSFGRAAIEVSGEGKAEIHGRIRSTAKFSVLVAHIAEGDLPLIDLAVVELKPVIPKSKSQNKLDVVILLKR